MSGLLADRHERSMQVVEPDGRDLARRERQQCQGGEVVEAQGPLQLWSCLAVLVFEAHRAHVPLTLRLDACSEPRRHLFEGAVLQQSCEEQVARFE